MSTLGMSEVKGRMERAVYAAIDALNEQLTEEQRLEKSPETVLLGIAEVPDDNGR